MIKESLLKVRNKPVKILQYPDPILKKVSEPVDFEKMPLTKRLALARKMGVTLLRQTGGMRLGIAAPQIGVSLRVMIVRGTVMFNPEWRPVKTPIVAGVEGCYSIPGKIYSVDRPKYGWAKWTDVDGFPRSGKINGLAAIVFQHELDHLDGKCCNEVGTEIVPKIAPAPTPSEGQKTE